MRRSTAHSREQMRRRLARTAFLVGLLACGVVYETNGNVSEVYDLPVAEQSAHELPKTMEATISQLSLQDKCRKRGEYALICESQVHEDTVSIIATRHDTEPGVTQTEYELTDRLLSRPDSLNSVSIVTSSNGTEHNYLLTEFSMTNGAKFALGRATQLGARPRYGDSKQLAAAVSQVQLDISDLLY